MSLWATPPLWIIIRRGGFCQLDKEEFVFLDDAEHVELRQNLVTYFSKFFMKSSILLSYGTRFKAWQRQRNGFEIKNIEPDLNIWEL